MWIFEYFFEYLSQNGEYFTNPHLLVAHLVQEHDRLVGLARLGVRVRVRFRVRHDRL